MAKKETKTKTASADTKEGEAQLQKMKKQTKESTDSDRLGPGTHTTISNPTDRPSSSEPIFRANFSSFSISPSLVASDQVEEKGELRKEAKKRTSEDLDSKEAICASAELIQEQPSGEFDMSEPTMAEKLVSLDLVDDEKTKTTVNPQPSPIAMPPSADSIHLLMRQALHADDHSLLLDCLYTRDEKVITKSTSLLNPADVLKLIKSLTSMMQLRGAVLVCALPWIRSLLNQHASSTASQKSSLLILNSLYQLIESRISTFGSTLQLSTTLDVLSATIPDEEVEESSIPALIYEDRDSDEEEEEEEEEDVMETDVDDDDGEDLSEVIDIPYDFDGSDLMSD